VKIKKVRSDNGTEFKNANVDTLWRIAGALGMRLSDLIRMVEAEIETQSTKDQ